MCKTIKISIAIILFSFVGIVAGCKKFLNVDPPLALSGNNFWKTSSDFDQYILGIYGRFRARTMGVTRTADIQFFPCTGDFRCAPMRGQTSLSGDRRYVGLCVNNDMRTLTGSYSDSNWGNAFAKVTDWSVFYSIIASCNIMVEAIDTKSDGILNAVQKGQYRGEAVFMRNLIYFFMARLYGDIPYSTEAYNSKPETRKDMITVLKNCMADLHTVVNGLPWTYQDPSKRGNRAMRGSVLDLLMNINMWCAGFDQSNNAGYWQQTDSLGKVLLTQNEDAYSLLPLEETHVIFKGGSKESLFEITQSTNKGETFGLFSTFADNVLCFPYKQSNGTGNSETFAAYENNYILQLFPTGTADKRWKLFFYQNPSDPNNPFKRQYLKFLNFYATVGEDINPDDAQIIFRLPDAILLRAEACANLGKSEEAIALLDVIRKRASAPEYAENETPGLNLLDAIFYERCKELMGEGYYFFDLVRTRRILDPKFCYHPLSVSDFQQGAWTWPISRNVLNRNPGMTLNTYWTQ